MIRLIVLCTITAIFSIACGGGGGGTGGETESPVTNVLQNEAQTTQFESSPNQNQNTQFISEASQNNSVTIESQPQNVVRTKFDYSTTTTSKFTVSVNGINENGVPCKVQVRMVDLFGHDEFGQWTGYLSKDGVLTPNIPLAKANKTIKIVVHQPGKTSQHQIEKFNHSELNFQASYEIDLPCDTVINHHVDLVNIPTLKSKASNLKREKVPGQTEYVDRNVSVPNAVIQAVSTLLPESVMPSAQYLDKRYNPNLPIIADAEIEVTFIHEGAGYKNTFGYFTYTVNEAGVYQIVDRQLIFPNTSYPRAGLLSTGDTSKLRDQDGNIRTFKAGENVGFFVIANGYQGQNSDGSAIVAGWDENNLIYPSVNPAINLGPAQGTFTTIDVLNPEMAAGRDDINRHCAMIRINGIEGFFSGEDFFIIGMEDIRRNRGSDNDFNDCVFVVTASPITAIATEEIISYDTSNPDSDLDGIVDVNDQWPTDPTKAYSVRTPSTGYATLVFEDLYPTVGDADYNDLVVNYAYQVIKNGFGEVKSVEGTFHLSARGSHLDHAFGVAFRNVNEEVMEGSTVSIERFDTFGQKSIQLKNMNTYQSTQMDGSQFLRITDVFSSTIGALPGNTTRFANTQHEKADMQAASAKLILTFNEPIDENILGVVPYDPFLYVNNGFAMIDIHLPGFEGFTDRPSHLPLESGPESFISDEGWPWALHLPVDFKYPLESTPIGTFGTKEPAYEDFNEWATSDGSNKADWFLRPKSRENKKFVIKDAIQGRNRNWER